MSEGTTLEHTPTWVVAGVCTVIVAISLAAERVLHFTGVTLKRKNQKPLFEALQKVKEELMLLGFISLLLTVFQNVINKICVPANVTRHMLPCKLEEGHESEKSTTCGKNKVPLLSTEALHHLHIFIFVLAIVHVTFCVLTVVFGGLRIRQWKRWEDDIAKNNYDSQQVPKSKMVTNVHQHEFIKDHFRGLGKNSVILGWLHSFLKQFYGSVTKSDYTTLRLGFIMTHCRSNPKFNFHKYMIRALEDDFKKVVGISWYLWIFVVIFLLLNVNDKIKGFKVGTYYWLLDAAAITSDHSFPWKIIWRSKAPLRVAFFVWTAALGWHTYFWIAFLPFVLLLAVGTKLEHVISQLAHEVAEKHAAIEGELVVQPSDAHFWLGRPRIVLFLIHFILFQNSFEIAFFFWIWVQYGFDSCIMGQVRYIVPRLIIGVFIQVLCSSSTLPLYAIVTQMGTSYKKAIFDEHVQVGLVGWAQKAKKKKGLRAAGNGPGQGSSHESTSRGIQLGSALRKASTPEEIQPAAGSENSK